MKKFGTGCMVVSLALLGCGGAPGEDPTEKNVATSDSALTVDQLQALADLKQAIVHYQDVDAARANGFVQLFPGCDDSAVLLFNFTKINQQVFHPNPADPPILLYDILPNGNYQLAGARWAPAVFVNGRPWTANTPPPYVPPPTLFGIPMNGPIPPPSVPPGTPKPPWLWVFAAW